MKLKVGDIITLNWNGGLGVPMYRNYDKATILKFNKKRIVVESGGVIYKILPEQTLEHFKKNNTWINKDKERANA